MKHYSPQHNNPVNIWQVIKGQPLSPLTCSGVIKLTARPQVTSSILQNFKTEVILPNGFGVAQNIISGDQKLFVHFSPIVPILGDILLTSFVILSGNIVEITISDGDGLKTYLPMCLSLH
jgi:hypothetical protein